MPLKLPDIVIETLIKALNDGTLIQKQARLCDLAALDFIPIEILTHLKLHHQKAIATAKKVLTNILQRKFNCLDDKGKLDRQTFNAYGYLAILNAAKNIY